MKKINLVLSIGAALSLIACGGSGHNEEMTTDAKVTESHGSVGGTGIGIPHNSQPTEKVEEKIEEKEVEKTEISTGNQDETSHQQPTANSQQPTANSQQPTANSQQPTANSQQPTANSQQIEANTTKKPVKTDNSVSDSGNSGSTGATKPSQQENTSQGTSTKPQSDTSTETQTQGTSSTKPESNSGTPTQGTSTTEGTSATKPQSETPTTQPEQEKNISLYVTSVGKKQLNKSVNAKNTNNLAANLTATLRNNSLISADEELSQQKENFAEGVTRIVDSSPSHTIKYFNQSLNYSQFGTTTTDYHISDLETKNEVTGSYSIGQLTDDFKEVADTITYQGGALISSVKEAEPTNTFLGELNATVKFKAGKDDPEAFKGTIKVNQKVTDKGIEAADFGFGDIDLKGSISTEESRFSNSENSAKTKFKGAFFGKSAEEIGGVVEGHDGKYGDYKGAFGGKSSNSASAPVKGEEESNPPVNKPDTEQPSSSQDTATTGGTSEPNTSPGSNTETSNSQPNLDETLGKRAFFYVHGNKNEQTEILPISEAMKEQEFFPKEKYPVTELNDSDGVNKTVDSNDSNFITTYYDKALSYSRFGSITTNYEGSINSEIDNYSIGVATENFGKLIEETTPTKRARYTGSAIISAIKDEQNAKTETFLGKLTADVNFTELPSDDGFNGSITIDKKVTGDGAITIESPFNPIELKGSVIAMEAVNNLFYGYGNNTDEPTFSGKFYGDNADELGGVINGHDNKYEGHYKGAFGGVRQPPQPPQQP